MRRIALIGLAAAIILVSAVAASASLGQYHARPLDRQNLGWIRNAATTKSTEFIPVAGWGPSDGMRIDTRGAISATLSATVTGGPIEFAMAVEDIAHGFTLIWMKPAFARFDPGSETISSSFTWIIVRPAGPYTVDLFYRSPNGTDVTLLGGTLVVQYAKSG